MPVVCGDNPTKVYPVGSAPEPSKEKETAALSITSQESQKDELNKNDTRLAEKFQGTDHADMADEPTLTRDSGLFDNDGAEDMDFEYNCEREEAVTEPQCTSSPSPVRSGPPTAEADANEAASVAESGNKTQETHADSAEQAEEEEFIDEADFMDAEDMMNEVESDHESRKLKENEAFTRTNDAQQQVASQEAEIAAASELVMEDSLTIEAEPALEIVAAKESKSPQDSEKIKEAEPMQESANISEVETVHDEENTHETNICAVSGAQDVVETVAIADTMGKTEEENNVDTAAITEVESTSTTKVVNQTAIVIEAEPGVETEHVNETETIGEAETSTGTVTVTELETITEIEAITETDASTGAVVITEVESAVETTTGEPAVTPDEETFDSTSKESVAGELDTLNEAMAVDDTVSEKEVANEALMTNGSNITPELEMAANAGPANEANRTNPSNETEATNQIEIIAEADITEETHITDEVKDVNQAKIPNSIEPAAKVTATAADDANDPDKIAEADPTSAIDELADTDVQHDSTSMETGNALKGDRDKSATPESGNDSVYAPIIPLDPSEDTQPSSGKRKRNRTADDSTRISKLGRHSKANINQAPLEDKAGKEDDDSANEEDVYIVEAIRSHIIHRGKVVKYEIKWEGYGEKDNTVEPASDIHQDCPDFCSQYWDLHEPRPSNAPRSLKLRNEETSPGSRRGVSDPLPKDILDTFPHDRSDDPFEYRSEDELYEMPDDFEYELVEMQKSRRRSSPPVTEHINSMKLLTQRRGITQDDVLAGFELAYVDDDWPAEMLRWDTDLKEIMRVWPAASAKWKEKNAPLLAYVRWKNGRKTAHLVEELHKNVLLQLLDYYECHLHFEEEEEIYF